MLQKQHLNYNFISNYLWPISSETVKRVLPLALLLAITRCPLAVDIRSIKPCLFFLFLLDGWKVLFGMTLFLSYFWAANIKGFFILLLFIWEKISVISLINTSYLYQKHNIIDKLPKNYSEINLYSRKKSRTKSIFNLWTKY